MRSLLRLLLVLALFLATGAGAQTYPEKPVRVVVPFAPGGLIDGSMRVLAPKMSEALGQTVVVENRGGAGGIVGTAEVSRSAPDGYTLLFSSESTALATHIYKNPGFDPERDLQPISHLLSVPIAVLVHASIPVTSIKELATYSKANPGKLSAGSGGQGTGTHLCLEVVKHQSGADYVHIPYKGAGPALTDFLAGQTQVFAVSTSLSAPHIRAGKAKGLAVASAKRASNLPDLPTTAEAGFPGIEYSTWLGIWGPTGLPAPILTRIRDAVLVALREPANAKRFTELGLETLGTTPEEFRRFMSAEVAKFGQAVKIAGLKPE